MTHQIDSLFTKYSFTEEEQHRAAMFSEENLKLIKHLRCIAAEQRIAHDIDINDISTIQREAVLKAEIIAFTYLLDLNQAALEYFRNLSQTHPED